MNAAVTTGSSSAYAKAAQLPANGAGLGKAQGSEKPGQLAAGNSTDSLDLSDHAKAILVRAKTDQVAADKLTAFLQSAKESVTGKPTAPASKDGIQIFDSLTGRNRSGSAGGEPASAGEFEDAVINRLIESHRNADGTVRAYSAVVRDVFTPATSAEQISDWYKTNGQAWIDSAQARPAEWGANEWGTSLAAAVQAREVTFHSAADFADLNFHNTYRFEGGDVGGSANVDFTYNKNASIFSDPNNHYMVSSDGTVVSWKKTAGAAPVSST